MALFRRYPADAPPTFPEEVDLWCSINPFPRPSHTAQHCANQGKITVRCCCRCFGALGVSDGGNFCPCYQSKFTSGKILVEPAEFDDILGDCFLVLLIHAPPNYGVFPTIQRFVTEPVDAPHFGAGAVVPFLRLLPVFGARRSAYCAATWLCEGRPPAAGILSSVERHKMLLSSLTESAR
ncbi:MAG: hypothetical protein LBE75_08860 [Burkholderiales bacterium]|nr:hypothetical protein [Burkholderiales bacterium]